MLCGVVVVVVDVLCVFGGWWCGVLFMLWCVCVMLCVVFVIGVGYVVIYMVWCGGGVCDYC